MTSVTSLISIELEQVRPVKDESRSDCEATTSTFSQNSGYIDTFMQFLQHVNVYVSQVDHKILGMADLVVDRT